MTTAKPLTPLYGVIFVNVIFQSFRLLVQPVAPICSCFGPGVHRAPRAVTVKGGPLAIAKRIALDGHEHGGSVTLSRQVLFVEVYNLQTEGSSPSGAINAPQACMRLILPDRKP
ncbi:hypothetical protein C8D77_1323 [Mesorhizobium loti]|uniref:Uncharacterized protein n=1 Tax=Rhizobium loti TaxID=381 RepID=A0A8E2W857_RHILI|nr:hypothetical protein [Mesorhizobium loti]PWJ84679.1 hypothetical protein C8D77_1323 [Mesorhizobium loti]